MRPYLSAIAKSVIQAIRVEFDSHQMVLSVIELNSFVKAKPLLTRPPTQTAGVGRNRQRGEIAGASHE
jgi:hypothetical protein